MADIELLKRLAEACDIERCADEEERDRNLNEFYSVLEPEDVAALIAENERLRMQLVACGVVAMANTQESAVKARDMHPDYMSASCQDVMRAVDSEIALRAELERVRADAERLDWLEAKNMPFKMGWRCGIAPAGCVSLSSVIQLGAEITPIRDAIDAAMGNGGKADG